MAAYLTTKTWTRAEWNEAQTKGTEGGFAPQNQMRASYEEYLKNAGFKDEAAAMAKRAEEDAAGAKFGEIKSWDEIKQLSERTDTPEYLARLDASHAAAKAEEARRIALLSKGTITGQEPVYIMGTPENLQFIRSSGGYQPDAYLDAQAFEARYMAYNRLGSNDPTSPDVYNPATGTFSRKPSPFYDPKIMVPTPGMGIEWDRLNKKMWSTVQAGVGATAATSDVEYEMDVMWRKQIGYPPGATIRDYNALQAAGGAVAGGTVAGGTVAGVGGGGITGAGGGSSTAVPKTTGTQLTNFVATDGTKFTTQDAFTTYQANLNKTAADTRSAIQIVTDRFNRYGLGSLAPKIQELGVLGATEATITLALQDTPEYQARFSANQNRLKQGLTVLSPAEYLSVEDGYRQVLRAYGLKQFDTDAYVQQFISNNTSPGEFSNRVITAVQRVQNADPAIIKQLRDYYGIGSADMVAYVLDPEQQFEKIKLQVAASEIGVMAGRQGLTAGVDVAEQLAKQGVTQAEAQKGYSTIADILPTADKLSEIYGKTTGTTYGQSEAEQEVFNSLASAQRKRQQLSALEVAQFSGQSGLSKAALTTQNKGNF